MDNRKELKQKYREMKPEMGIFRIESGKSGNCYLYASRDLKSLMNRFRFQLKMGCHPNRELQKEWSDQGADGFIVEVLERLDYDTDETKTDYDEDLKLLQTIWEEKLQRRRETDARPQT